jgi:hypothetical protein
VGSSSGRKGGGDFRSPRETHGIRAVMRMSRVGEPIDAGDAGPEVSKRIKNWVMGVRFR